MSLLVINYSGNYFAVLMIQGIDLWHQIECIKQYYSIVYQRDL